MPSDHKPDNVDYGATWGDTEYDFKTPSGAWCRLRKMDPLSLVEHGLLEKLDFVTSVVMNEHVENAKMSTAQRVKAQREREKSVEDKALASSLEMVMEDPAKISNLRQVLDEVAIQAVVNPVIHPVPKTRDQREAGLVYTDMVSFTDKMAIFNSAMKGVNTMAQFREVPGEVVGDVAPEPSVRPAAKPRARRATQRKSG